MKNETRATLTVLTVSMSLLVVHLITKSDWPVIVSLIIGMAGGISSKVAVKIEYAWKGLTKLLGLIAQRLVLILIFYFILFPVAVAARLIGKRDPLQLLNNSSTFTDINKTFEKREFEKPW